MVDIRSIQNQQQLASGLNSFEIISGWSNPVLIDETLPGSMGVTAPDIVQTTP